MFKKTMVISLILGLVIVSGCQSATEETEKISLRIMAAASLIEVFTDLEQGFEEKYPNIEVDCNYAGSQALFSQIKSGVTADIFASANVKYMNQLEESDMVIEPSVFAQNKLVVAVLKGNKKIQTINDFVEKDVKLVVADKSVPVGQYTIEMLDKVDKSGKFVENYKTKFLNSIDSKELDVKSVVSKIELGEADAGVVYKTDIIASNQEKVRGINIPNQYNIVTTYPIALLKVGNQQHQEASKNFLDYLYSLEGRKILTKYGFIKESR
ncbi:molybdate ABC transporter substrate-binding protein [Halanaerocella petrolearia]